VPQSIATAVAVPSRSRVRHC